MKNKSFKWLRSLFLAIVLTTVTVMGLHAAHRRSGHGTGSGQGYRGAVHQ